MLTQGGPAAILGGWQLSGVLQLQTGFPYTIDYKGDPDQHRRRQRRHSGPAQLCAGGQRPDQRIPICQPACESTSRYFNTAAFVQPVVSFGDVGRNTMTGANLCESGRHGRPAIFG